MDMDYTDILFRPAPRPPFSVLLSMCSMRNRDYLSAGAAAYSTTAVPPLVLPAAA